MKLDITGDLRVPGDKSITHRALMFAAAAQGESRLRHLLTGDDCRDTAQILRALGAEIPDLLETGGNLSVRSTGLEQWRAPREVLDCGNSGTTARLMMGLLAGRPFCSTITGDASLRSRPMRRITDPMATMGAGIRELEEPDRLPIEVCGAALRPIEYRSPRASAQIKSAILLAGLSAGVEVSVLEPVQSRDHTERMLEALGATLFEEQREEGWFVRCQPPERPLEPFEMEIPGDPSSAAFFVALAALADSGELRLREVGINATRTGFFDALRAMGGAIDYENERITGGERIADLVITPSRLRGIRVAGPEIPAMIDEIPILACLAARAEGETRIIEADELRAKESDRIRAMVENLRAIGVDAEELPDGLVVRGSDRPLQGRIRALHDHRIAMAFGILGALPGNSIEVDTPEVVEISFPHFWTTLQSLTRASSQP